MTCECDRNFCRDIFWIECKFIKTFRHRCVCDLQFFDGKKCALIGLASSGSIPLLWSFDWRERIREGSVLTGRQSDCILHCERPAHMHDICHWIFGKRLNNLRAQPLIAMRVRWSHWMFGAFVPMKFSFIHFYALPTRFRFSLRRTHFLNDQRSTIWIMRK